MKWQRWLGSKTCVRCNYTLVKLRNYNLAMTRLRIGLSPQAMEVGRNSGMPSPLLWNTLQAPKVTQCSTCISEKVSLKLWAFSIWMGLLTLRNTGIVKLRPAGQEGSGQMPYLRGAFTQILVRLNQRTQELPVGSSGGFQLLGIFVGIASTILMDAYRSCTFPHLPAFVLAGNAAITCHSYFLGRVVFQHEALGSVCSRYFP